MTRLAQNEMKAKRGMPLRVRSMEGLGATARGPTDGFNCDSDPRRRAGRKFMVQVHRARELNERLFGE
jgi:hypothetical protein